jgi:hypothetical protein
VLTIRSDSWTRNLSKFNKPRKEERNGFEKNMKCEEEKEQGRKKGIRK